ncbi:hypothetical protein QCA50_006694 [Cerrena zonata]|uniref:Pet127-domain-containing protein n=1 Tax=Cerrena zonata TaxID=2478898 RepID=A0AAW0GFQ9_9APHY
MKDLKSPTPMRPIAQLEHGLDRVLFNPGVHWVQDPRSRVYNFSPRLQAIPKVEEFAFDRVTGFIKSSSDNDLRTLAKRENCRFVGSTSSLTGMLSHIYFLLSSIRPPTLDQLSHGFMKQTTKSSGATPTFSYGQRLPVSILLNYKDGVYATDYDPSDPGMTERNILTWQGTLLEKYLTASPEEFETLLRKNPPADGPVDTRREAYRYAKCGNYVMRSQLDCYDPRLPGTGVFDLKTRAALPIRRDLFNYEANSGYLIRSLQGSFESFEREYYDLIRAAFLKYSFQARIGNMDGIFAAYHNTARIFGFQYIPLEEMDQALYGHKDVGMRIFEKCLNMLEVISSEVTQLFPNESVSCLWDTEEDGHEMHVWVQPKEWKVELGPPPLIQLDVQATSYVDGKRIFGHELPESIAGNKWELRWTIKTAELSPKQIFQNKQAAKEKQSIYWSLPAGMDKEQAAKWISDLDFAGKGSPSTLAKPSIFRPPDDFVKHLRYLSRCGKKETDRMERAEAGKTKIIWGNPEPVPVVLGEGIVQKAEKAEGNPKRPKHEKPGKQLSDTERKSRAESKARKDARRLAKRKDKKAAMRKAAVLAELRQEQPKSEPTQRVPEFRAASETSMAMTRNKSAHVQSILGKIYLRYSNDESNPTVNASLPTLTLPWTAAKKEEVFE